MQLTLWTIAALSIAGVIVRPFAWPEAIWAVGGAALIVVLGLLPVGQALQAIGKGGDVYLFLVGMMLLSEVARREGLFDRVAAIAVNHARRSPMRLFTLIYLVGIVVTTFLSNDAAAVVLTPAVYAATKKARVEPLPYLFICAFIANAASFVLPISNPANLVLYGDHTPALASWLARFALPSLLSIVATYVALRAVEGRRLGTSCESDVETDPMTRGGWIALAGLVATAIVLLVVSAFDIDLGLPTATMGLATTTIVVARSDGSKGSVAARAWAVGRAVSWSVLALVAGLFVLVEGVARTGVIDRLAQALTTFAADGATRAAWASGVSIAVVSNGLNNLPAGLIASSTIRIAHPPLVIVDALLIGVDLGPNLSVTGSLATILWLSAIRREGTNVGFWRFLRTGALVMTPALGLALAARLLIGH